LSVDLNDFLLTETLTGHGASEAVREDHGQEDRFLNQTGDQVQDPVSLRVNEPAAIHKAIERSDACEANPHDALNHFVIQGRELILSDVKSDTKDE
jgi:hypothetical protein